MHLHILALPKGVSKTIHFRICMFMPHKAKETIQIPVPALLFGKYRKEVFSLFLLNTGTHGDTYVTRNIWILVELELSKWLFFFLITAIMVTGQVLKEYNQCRKEWNVTPTTDTKTSNRGLLDYCNRESQLYKNKY